MRLLVELRIEIVESRSFGPVAFDHCLFESLESEEISERHTSTPASLTEFKWPTQGVIKKFAASWTLSTDGHAIKLAGRNHSDTKGHQCLLEV